MHGRRRRTWHPALLGVGRTVPGFPGRLPYAESSCWILATLQLTVASLACKLVVMMLMAFVNNIPARHLCAQRAMEGLAAFVTVARKGKRSVDFAVSRTCNPNQVTECITMQQCKHRSTTSRVSPVARKRQTGSVLGAASRHSHAQHHHRASQGCANDSTGAFCAHSICIPCTAYYLGIL